MKYLKLWENFFSNSEPKNLATIYRLNQAKKENDTFSETYLGNVDGFSLIYQTYSKIMGGNGINGSIRTAPQNYYVATITNDGDIIFEDLETNTKNINKEKVERLYDKLKSKGE